MGWIFLLADADITTSDGELVNILLRHTHTLVRAVSKGGDRCMCPSSHHRQCSIVLQTEAAVGLMGRPSTVSLETAQRDFLSGNHGQEVSTFFPTLILKGGHTSVKSQQ